jgi:hypothetical protein
MKDLVQLLAAHIPALCVCQKCLLTFKCDGKQVPDAMQLAVNASNVDVTDAKNPVVPKKSISVSRDVTNHLFATIIFCPSWNAGILQDRAMSVSKVLFDEIMCPCTRRSCTHPFLVEFVACPYHCTQLECGHIYWSSMSS